MASGQGFNTSTISDTNLSLLSTNLHEQEIKSVGVPLCDFVLQLEDYLPTVCMQ